MDAETLRTFERRFASLRTTAGVRETFAAYVVRELPDTYPPGIGQGYEAGYDAAMDRVSKLLAEMQTEALRKAKEPEHRDDGQCHAACWDAAVAEWDAAHPEMP